MGFPMGFPWFPLVFHGFPYPFRMLLPVSLQLSSRAAVAAVGCTARIARWSALWKSQVLNYHWVIWRFHKMGVPPIAGWFTMENPKIKWRVWGYPLFRNICRTIPVDGYHHNLYPKKTRRKEFQPQICSNATRKKGARIWLWFNLCGINELMILSNELLDAVDTATLCWLMTRYGISLNHLVQTYLATKGNRYDEPFMVGGEGVILRPWNLVFDTSTKIEYAGRRLVLSSLIILSIEWMTTGSPSFKHPHLYTYIYIYVYTYSHMYICVFFFLPLGHQQASPSRSLLMPSMA